MHWVYNTAKNDFFLIQIIIYAHKIIIKILVYMVLSIFTTLGDLDGLV